MKRLFPYLFQYKAHLIAGLLLSIGITALVAVAPMIEGLITTSIANSLKLGEALQLTYIYKILFILVGIFIISATFKILFNFTFIHAIQHSMKNLRNDVQKKIHKLPVKYFDDEATGNLMSRMTTDVEAISTGLQQTLGAILNALFLITFITIFMFMLNSTLAIIGVLMVPLSLIIALIIVRQSQKIFTKRFEAFGVLSGFLQEQYTGYKDILLYNKQEKAIHNFKEANEQLSKLVFKSNYVSGLLMPVVSGLTYFSIILIILVGAKMMIEGTLVGGKVLELGVLQAFIRYMWQLSNPIIQLSQMSVIMQSMQAANKRIFDFLLLEDEINVIDEKIDLPQVKGDITFENVSFGYTEDKYVLKNISFKAYAGQTIAIVGPTGSGKTTLINLLMRFYEVTSGRILLDGVDISKIDKDVLRKHFGMVLQDTWLFKGSIIDNIKYGRDNATKEDVIKASRLANIDHYIQTLPQGYEMQINAEADNISQGEKQLLTIARALLANPQILILDEATSTVDTRLEMRLQEAVANTVKNRTSLVIAHRLSTIKNADQIIVIKDGNLIEMGNHQTLLVKKGFYYQLYMSQFQES